MPILEELASTLDVNVKLIIAVFLVVATVLIALIRAGAVERIARFILDLIEFLIK